MSKEQHELVLGTSSYWIATSPKTVEGVDGHSWSGSGGRLMGWVAGPVSEALKEAREAYVAHEALHRIATRVKR